MAARQHQQFIIYDFEATSQTHTDFISLEITWFTTFCNIRHTKYEDVTQYGNYGNNTFKLDGTERHLRSRLLY